MTKTTLMILALLVSGFAQASTGAGVACDHESMVSKEVLNLNSYFMVGNLTCEVEKQKNYLETYNLYRSHFRKFIAKHAAQVHHSLQLCSTGAAEANYNHYQTVLGNQWGMAAAQNGAFCLQAQAVLMQLMKAPSDENFVELARRMKTDS